MNARARHWVAGVLIAAAAPAAATKHALDGDAVRALLVQRVDAEQRAPGMVVGIIDGRGARILAHGMASPASATPVDADTLFEIGSITKPTHGDRAGPTGRTQRAAARRSCWRAGCPNWRPHRMASAASRCGSWRPIPPGCRGCRPRWAFSSRCCATPPTPTRVTRARPCSPI
jgi:hypothetical protein